MIGNHRKIKKLKEKIFNKLPFYYFPLMKLFFSLLKILRPFNCVTASLGTLLGGWIAEANLTKGEILTLLFVTFTATGFGNVINDIADINTDKISHPERPLPSGILSIKLAICYSIFLASVSIIGAFSVRVIFGIGTIIPLILLVLYAFIFKGIPFVGNIIVSLLVPYSLVFPSIGAPNFWRIFIPCVIAFFLNFSREIVKTLQDEAGDRALGLITAAVFSRILLKRIIVLVNLLSIIFIMLQYYFGFSGNVYIILVAIIVIPLQMSIFYFIFKYNLTEKIKILSLLYKLEMVIGIIAFGIDNFFFVNK